MIVALTLLALFVAHSVSTVVRTTTATTPICPVSWFTASCCFQRF
jgi:hypothetical protein